MSVTHSAAARNAATDAVTALIGASGLLQFRTSGTIGSRGTIVATLALTADAFTDSGAEGYQGAGTQPATAGTAWANAISSDTNADGGTVATATLDTSGGTTVIHCAVAASASDINMTGGLTVGAGDTVTCTLLSYTALSA